MKRFTLFISDLHLQQIDEQITALFDTFLRDYAPKADAVYILGDLFEAWLGDDDLNDFNMSIINKIRQLVDSGIPVFVMPGNRDFLLGNRFAKLTSSTLLTDPTVINLYNKPILLMHGDTLCTHDRLHQNYRRIVQNPTIKRLSMVLLPLCIRRRIGGWLRKQSKRHTSRQTAPNMDVINASVIRQFQNHPAPILLHGHTHRPLIETLYINDQPHSRYVLGAWHERGSAICIDVDHKIEYLTIT